MMGITVDSINVAVSVRAKRECVQRKTQHTLELTRLKDTPNTKFREEMLDKECFESGL